MAHACTPQWASTVVCSCVPVVFKREAGEREGKRMEKGRKKRKNGRRPLHMVALLLSLHLDLHSTVAPPSFPPSLPRLVLLRAPSPLPPPLSGPVFSFSLSRPRSASWPENSPPTRPPARLARLARMNKREIKEYLQSIYKVDVQKVNTQIVLGTRRPVAASVAAHVGLHLTLVHARRCHARRVARRARAAQVSDEKEGLQACLRDHGAHSLLRNGLGCVSAPPSHRSPPHASCLALARRATTTSFRTFFPRKTTTRRRRRKHGHQRRRRPEQSPWRLRAWSASRNAKARLRPRRASPPPGRRYNGPQLFCCNGKSELSGEWRQCRAARLQCRAARGLATFGRRSAAVHGSRAGSRAAADGEHQVGLARLIAQDGAVAAHRKLLVVAAVAGV